MVTLVTIIGVINAVIILIRIDWGLYFFTALIPLSVILPATPIKGLNGTTILILLLFYKSFSQPKAVMKNDQITDLKIPICGLFFITLFSIITSTVLYDHQTLPLIKYFEKCWRWFIYIFLYFIYKRELTTKKMITYALIGVVAGLFIEGAFVLKAFIISGRLRSYGTLMNPNELAQFFSSYYLLLFVMLLYEKRKDYKIFFLGSIILSLFGIASSLSRGGFLCTLLAFAIFLYLKSKKMFVIFVIMGVLFPSTLYSILPDKITARIKESFIEEGEHRRYGSNVIAGVGVESSALSRIPLVKGGLVMFKENPIFGKGFMSFPLLIHKFKYGGKYGIEPGHEKASHNMHIRILSELGLAGYIFFILIFYYSIKLGYILYKRASDKFDKNMGVILICATVAFLIGCLFGDRFFRGILINYFFVNAACCYNLYCLEFSETN